MTEEKNFEMNELNEQALEETAGGSKNYYLHDRRKKQCRFQTLLQIC